MGVPYPWQKMNKQDKSELFKSVALEKLKRGEWISTEPFGYTRDYAHYIDRGNNPIFIDEEEGAAVRMLFELYDTGAYSQRALIDELKKRTPFSISRSQIYNILSNKFYCGIMEVNGVSYPHYYGNIIPQELFNSVQSRLSRACRNQNQRSKKHQMKYRSMFRCSQCECLFSGDIKKKLYIYYSCTLSKVKHPKKYITEEKITEQLQRKLKELRIYADISKLLNSSTLEVQHIILRNIFPEMHISSTSLEIIFTEINTAWIDNKEEAYKKLERLIHRAIEVPHFEEVFEDPIVFEPDSLSAQLMKLCASEISLDELFMKTKVDVTELQTALFDLQMLDKIIETKPGSYKIK